jgi:methylenetetrahydrofolate dehydrogenase (NADP+)/methenyltetrahydrofolate cyclohydrolase
VTVVHTGVPDWADYNRVADVVIAAAGVPGILRPEHITADTVVVGGGALRQTNASPRRRRRM